MEMEVDQIVEEMNSTIAGGGDAVTGQEPKPRRKANAKVKREKPKPIVRDGEEEFAVEAILQKRLNKKGKPLYLVKWQDCDSDENTWEPADNLKNARDILQEFEASLKSKSGVAAGSSKGKRVRFQVQRKRTGAGSSSSDDEDCDSDSSSGSSSNSGSLFSATIVRRPRSALPLTLPPGDMKNVALYAMKQVLSPLYCVELKASQVPLCVLGSRILHGVLVHIIRLKPKTEEETQQVLDNPYGNGLSQNNCAVVNSSYLKEKYPNVLIEYYSKNFKLYDDVKDLDQKAREAAVMCLINHIKKRGVDKKSNKLVNDLMEELWSYPRSEDVVDSLKASDIAADTIRKVQEIENDLLRDAETEAKGLKGAYDEHADGLSDAEPDEQMRKSLKRKFELDQYGLPDQYGTSSSSSDVSTTSGSSSDEETLKMEMLQKKMPDF